MDAMLDVFVVAEDEQGNWLVSSRTSDTLFGPFVDQQTATVAARRQAALTSRWKILVIDASSVVVANYQSDSAVG